MGIYRKIVVLLIVIAGNCIALDGVMVSNQPACNAYYCVQITRISGRTLAVVGSAWGLQIFNVDSAASITQVGTCALPYGVQHIVVTGNLVYAPDSVAGLQIIDISNPQEPAVRPPYQIPGYKILDMAISKNWAAVLINPYGYATNKSIRILDLTNPLFPVSFAPVSNLTSIGDEDFSVTADSSLLFISGNSDGMNIFDLSNPAQAQKIISYNPASGSLSNIIAQDTLVYVYGQDSNVYCFTISDPVYPVLLGSYMANQVLTGMAVAGRFLYCATDSDKLFTVDLHNPPYYQVLDSSSLPGALTGLTVDNGKMYGILDNQGLIEFDISDSARPALCGKSQVCACNRADISVSNGHAYVQTQDSALEVLSLKSPLQPQTLDSVKVARTGSLRPAIATSSQYLFAAADSLIQIFSLGDPDLPQTLGSYNAHAIVSSFAFLDTILAVGCDSIMQLVDIQDPARPQICGTYNAYDRIKGMALYSNAAFITANSVIEIVNISNLQKPFFVDNINAVTGLSKILIAGHYLYTLKGYNTIEFLDIGNPFAPCSVGAYTSSAARINGFALNGINAVILESSVAHLLDISHPSSPAITNTYKLEGFVLNFALWNNVVYYLTGDGLQTLTIDASFLKTINPQNQGAAPGQNPVIVRRRNGVSILFPSMEAMRCDLYNSIGQRLGPGAISKNEQTNSLTITNLAHGVYFLKIGKYRTTTWIPIFITK